MKKVILIGYSGHGYVIADIFFQMGRKVTAYCDSSEKAKNPLQLSYLGQEDSDKAMQSILEDDYFIAIGDNLIRQRIYKKLVDKVSPPINAIHPSAIISSTSIIGNGVMVGSLTSINAFAIINNGAILNTACIIEHECQIGKFSHIAPGAVLTGNVRIGDNTFVGANSVVKQGVIIGSNVVIGAGSVVLEDIPDNVVAVGNPAKIIKWGVNATKTHLI
ncbi:MAG: acetyltransferase [Saprospiraceae bacterium]|nr:acetyltransferase [Saprospiraceae bacterium]